MRRLFTLLLPASLLVVCGLLLAKSLVFHASSPHSALDAPAPTAPGPFMPGRAPSTPQPPSQRPVSPVPGPDTDAAASSTLPTSTPTPSLRPVPQRAGQDKQGTLRRGEARHSNQASDEELQEEFAASLEAAGWASEEIGALLEAAQPDAGPPADATPAAEAVELSDEELQEEFAASLEAAGWAPEAITDLLHSHTADSSLRVPRGTAGNAQ